MSISFCLALSTCELQGQVTVDSGNPPTFRIEEKNGCGEIRPGFARGVRVATVEGRSTVWEARGPRRQFTEPTVYGQPPDGWVNVIEPEAIERGVEYSVEISGGVGLDGTARFRAVTDVVPQSSVASPDP